MFYSTTGSADASGSHPPTLNNNNSANYSPVTDGDTDIAETLDGERTKVQAPGRLPMQLVYLRKGNTNGRKKTGKGLTNIPYDPKEDGPVTNPVGSLSTAQELLPSGPNAVQYLEAGIVIGDDPSRFKPAPNADRKNKEARRQRGEMPRHTSAMRVFIPVIPAAAVARQAKYYVGVKPVDGCLQPRIINSECVFFYPEFWQGVEGATKKGRRAFMYTRMKQLAVSTQTTQDELGTATKATADETASPEVVDGPGLKSFFDFDTELILEDAENVARELKVRGRENKSTRDCY
jgi:hypothetical protein